ncbi:MAG: PAS domain-containing sensor histidine kinase, partial [Betaproteobacteria bacterium]|nr:PAS domain-containing sensor histidine kinase [Betaproteobacteria bacterium]
SGGTGLGLAIVKHVLQRHQARLEIRSEPGKGSTFSCAFPASRLAPASDHAAEVTSSGAA